MNQRNMWNFVLLVCITSTIGLFIAMLFYVAIHDALLVKLYDVVSDFETKGMLDSAWVTLSQSAVELFEMIPEVIDILWFAGFITMIASLIRESYFAKRDGYWSMFTFITLGVLILMFVSSLIMPINDWLYTVLIEGILSNVSVQLKFFNFYISNYAIINLLVIAACIVANFIDFDFAKFNARKEKEVQIQNDEVV